MAEGQQIRSDAGADGHSPDERRRSRAWLQSCASTSCLGAFSLDFRGERFMSYLISSIATSDREVR